MKPPLTDVRGSTQTQLLEKALAGLPGDEISLRARLLARLAGLQRDLGSPQVETREYIL